jgi:hypothetical protein
MVKRIVFFILLIIFSVNVFSQNTTPGFTQPLGTVLGRQTVINMLYAPTPAYGLGYALVYYPDDYFLPQNANKRYPTFFFCPGNGEHNQINIIEVLNTSVPKLISQGLNPYGIDPITHDTIKWIVVSQHNPGGGGAYAYPQLQYTIPYMLSGQAGLRIDTSCFWIGGLSGGGRATWSVPMGTTPRTDTLIGKRITGIMPMANGGFDNFISVTNMNLDTVARRGLATLYIIGDQDPGWNGPGGMAYNDTMTRYSQAGKYKFRLVLGGTHSENVWNVPFPLNADPWNTGINSWTLMWTLRKTATVSTLTADAGVDQNINLPTAQVSLSGSGTTPSGTSITSYLWSQISGPNTGSITSANSANTTVTGLIQGTYVFRLQVINSASSVATDQISVIVNAQATNPPIVSTNGPGSITLPTNSASLTGSAVPQGTNTITGVQWTQTSGPNTATISTSSNVNTNVTGLIQGTYVFRLTATDSRGQTSFSTAQVIVNPASGPPVTANTVVDVACSEYAVTYRFKDSSIRKFTYNQTSGHVQLDPYIIGGRKAIGHAPLFNTFIILDDQHYMWRTLSGNSNNALGNNNTFRMDVDTLGNTMNDVESVYGYFFTGMCIRTDGTIWQYAGDDYNFVFGTNPVYDLRKPVKINQPAGARFVKLAMGQHILGLTDDGRVFEWHKGTTAYTQIPLAGIAEDIGASHLDFSIIIERVGSSAGYGYPYWFGGQFGMVGATGGVAPTNPQPLKTLWQMTSPIKDLAVTNNTVHYIDSLGRMFGIGDNPNGEIGNGVELVNHSEIYPTPYAWSWGSGEAFTGAPPIQIGIGITWKRIYGGPAFSYFNYAQDINDSLYFWGRNKSFCGGDGVNQDDESIHPNIMDILRPSLRTPISISPTQTVVFHSTLPTIKADTGVTKVRNIITTSTTLLGSGTPLTLSATGRPNYGYGIASWLWTKLSGPNCTIVSPNSPTSDVTGMATGSYKFKLLLTDNNTGTIADTVTINVNTSQPLVNAGIDQTFQLPVNSTVLSGTASAGSGQSLVSLTWTQVSGPNTANILNAGAVSTTVNGFIAGTYIFKLTVKDDANQTAFDTVQITVNGSTPFSGNGIKRFRGTRIKLQ